MPNREPNDELLKAALSGTGDCPPLEELERLLTEGATLSLKVHVDGCPHCQTELQMLRSFTSNEVAEHERAAVSSIAARLKSRSAQIMAPHAVVEEYRSWWKGILGIRWLTPAAATAAVLLIVAGIAVDIRQKKPLLDTRIAATQVLRSSSIAIL